MSLGFIAFLVVFWIVLTLVSSIGPLTLPVVHDPEAPLYWRSRLVRLLLQAVVVGYIVASIGVLIVSPEWKTVWILLAGLVVLSFIVTSIGLKRSRKGGRIRVDVR